MNILIWAIFVFASVFLIYLGYTRNDRKLITAGGALLLVSGVLLLAFGVDYKVGESELINMTTAGNNTLELVTRSDVYDTFQGGQDSYGLSYVLFFLGVYFIIWPIIEGQQEKKQRRKERFNREEEQ